MAHVKSAISIEESVFLRMETLARELGMPRSRLFTVAMSEYLDRHERRKMLEKIDAAYAEPPAEGDRAWTQAARRRLGTLNKDVW
jgi:hypothetical protein